MADAMAEIEDLKKKLSANPDSMIFVPLADAYRKAGMLDEAVDVCKSGLEKHPSYTSARVVLGRIYSEKDMLDEAIEELKKVETIDVDNIMVHTMLGNAYLKKKMHAEAIEQFQRVLSLNPDDDETQEKLTEALSAKQEPEKTPAEPTAPPAPAKKDVPAAASAKAEDGLDVAKSMKVAELYTKKEEFEKAIELYRELLDHDNENMILQQRLREVYDLQSKKIKKEQKKQSAAAPAPVPVKPVAAPNAKIDTDKITAEDILDVMKEAVEEDKVDDEKPAAKLEEPKKEVPAEVPAKAEEAKPVASGGSVKVEKPKAEEPKAKVEPAKAESSAGIDGAKKKEVEEVLKSFSGVDGMIGSFFLLRNGTIVASVLPSSINASEIGNTVATIVDKTEKSVKNMEQGRLNQVVISSERGQLLFTEIGKGVLFMIGDENINVGKMGLMLKNVIGKLKDAVL